MKPLNSLRLIAVAIVMTISSTGIISAQENIPSGKSYIYCAVTFDYVKVYKERQVQAYTQKYSERVLNMKIDCRQYDSDITDFYEIINDENGDPREFSSQMAGINWLGLMGWEIIPYPVQYRPEHITEITYWFRMDVSGLSHDEINRKLSALRPKK